MSLQKYWEKRDFDVTPEPKGTVVKSSKQLRYYIQRHHASHLHYDFRLELDGTLKSWAIPKGPSLDPKDKRLAVHVEDHPISYGTFEGSIPAGQYGAGKVILWDLGVWIPLVNPEQGYKSGNLKFELVGHKLAGKWALVRMGKPGAKENWLLIKEKDEIASSGPASRITETRPESVKGLQLGQKAVQDAKEVELARAMPASIKPQLATLVDHAPTGKEWLSETKYDGYRALTRITDSKATIFTRNGNDWTQHWPLIAKQLSQLPIDDAWLDGEVVAVKKGRISFSALQNYDAHDPSAELKYYLFDLIYLNGHDVASLPLIDRKSLLKELLASQPPDSPLVYSQHIAGDAQGAIEIACRSEQEGIVIKQADAPYLQTRTHNWLKLKCAQRQEFVIAGYTDPEGSRTGFGALILGWYDAQGSLVYAGRVGTGFNGATIASLGKKFERLKTTTPAFPEPLTGKDAKGVHYLKPELVAEVKFAEWTPGGIVRHASFIALRSDKPPTAITREVPVVTRVIKPTAAKSAKNADAAKVNGIVITHPQRIIYSAQNITKLDVAEYYRFMEKWLLPHLKDRPLSLLRCPNGFDQECFFQKHMDGFRLQYIKKININADDKGHYLVVNDIKGVIELAQFGVLELHTWGSTTPSLHKPDRLIFDLDPDPAVSWPMLVEGAQLVKYALEAIGLKSFVKTTGGKGLHVVVPIRPRLKFPEIKTFTKSIADHLASTVPSHFVAVMTKAKRKNRIYVDYLRNAEEATAVAAYSIRARPGATISTPILWEELTADMRPDKFTMRNIRERIRDLSEDPWHDFHSNAQDITQEMIQAFG